MHTVTVKKEINTASSKVWQVLDDFGSIFKYNPGVKTSAILGDLKTGAGAKRICNFYDGSSLKETIFDYQPGISYSFELSDFALPLKTARTHFRLLAKTQHSCEVSISLEFQPKFGPLGWLMAKLLIKPMMTKALKGLAKGLDDHIKTGKLIGKDGHFVSVK